VGPRSEVDPLKVAPVPLRISSQQVIFTSIRSPTGQGYRIIAASPGVKPEEKTEIIQRSPSHGSLCDASERAVGLIAYPLSTGRYCVACCTHAGVEHTARGGLRVYTHVAVLDPADFDAVRADPAHVHAAMLARLREDGPMLTPPPSLEPLTLNIMLPFPPAEETQETDENNAGLESANEKGSDPILCEDALSGEPRSSEPALDPFLTGVAADVEAGKRVIVVGATDPMATLRALMEILPFEARRRLSSSVGLTYSPGRRLQLTILPGEGPELRRLVAGQDIAIHRLPAN